MNSTDVKNYEKGQAGSGTSSVLGFLRGGRMRRDEDAVPDMYLSLLPTSCVELVIQQVHGHMLRSPG